MNLKAAILGLDPMIVNQSQCKKVMRNEIKILILEHRRDDIELILDELHTSGVNFVSSIVQVESSFRNAITAFIPDIILSDFCIFSFDGAEAFKICKALAPDTPFIFVSESISKEQSNAYINNGVTDYVLKDKLFTLVVKMKRALHEAKEQQEKRKIQQELIKNERLLARTQQIARLGSWEFDLADNMLRLSAEGCRIFGFPPDQNSISFDTWSSLVHPDDRGKVLKIITQAIATRSNTSYHYRTLSKDGAIKHVFSESKFEFDITENPTGMYGIIQDITDSTKTANKIEENEKKYRQIVETAQEGIWLIDENNYTTLVNKKMADILEYTPGEMTGKQNYFFMDEEWKLKASENIVDRRLGLNENHDFKYITKSGKEVWANLSTNPVFDDDGIYRGALAMVTDITEKKKGVADLIKRESQFTLAAEMAKLGYWEYDLLDDVFTFNDQFYAIFKTTAIDVGGYTMSSARYAELFVHPDDREIVERSVAEAIKSNDASFSFKAEHRIMYANGDIGYISVHFYLVKDENGHPVKNFGVNQDITEKKLIEIKLHEMNASLHMQAKELSLSNAELEQFAFVTSDDLQEPLRMVTSFLILLEKKYGDLIDEKGQKYIAFAVDGARRMREIILDLLEFSRVSTLEDKMEIVDLNEMLEDIQKLFRNTIKDKSARIHSLQLPVIKAMKGPIRQVFQNLVSNALKYAKGDFPCEITITAEESTSYWQFAVTDNGIGIEKEYFDKIFVIFQRLHNKDEYSGTGMGLAISKKIVENMGGSIWVESQEGKGSAFYFTIAKTSTDPLNISFVQCIEHATPVLMYVRLLLSNWLR